MGRADLRAAARALGVERPALAVRRRLLPAHARRDARDHGQLVALLRGLPADACCLDAGAHAGSVLREMVRAAPQGRHVAWEPLPDFAARLRSAFPQVEVRTAALGDAAADAELFVVAADPGWSGLHRRPTPSGDPAVAIPVRVERLDDVQLPGPPAFLKIDVEGAEAALLRGAQATLARHRPLVAFEHGAGSADLAGSGPEEVHSLLTALGYAVHGLDGDGPHDLAAFTRIFAAGERVNFLARP